VFLAVASDAEWRRCWETIERPDLADDVRFATAEARANNDAALATKLTEALGRRSASEWEERFVANRVAGMRADITTPGVFFAHDPQMLAETSRPCAPTRASYIADGADRACERRPRRLRQGVLAGEHTDEISRSSRRGGDARCASRVVASEPVE
jgi:crotonobetainyl-CoA:carnitine CoA-transferase CaiB-like acyl-CoA transferase